MAPVPALLDASRFLLQLVAVLMATWSCGRVARWLRQPAVVGEIAGGLLLGPTCFGDWLPDAAAWLFPPGHLRGLEWVSNAGLVLFLFGLGAEMHLPALARSRRILLGTAAGSVALPLVCGVALAAALMPRHAHPGMRFWPFALFVGTAMSVTALPVLGRILQDRAAAGRPVRLAVARLALGVAARNDAAAWLLLLLALSLARPGAGLSGFATHLLLFLLLLSVLVFAVRPLFTRAVKDGRMPWALVLSCCVLLAFGSAAFTDRLGLHAFSGAVLAGVCAPRAMVGGRALAERFQQTLGPGIGIALPVFFALTGLRTRLDLHGSGSLWLLAILATAVGSKVSAGILGARAGGLPWRWALETGVLLNTRGLVELVVLNVGRQAGVLDSALFAMLVTMALFTTAMTVPLLNLLRPRDASPSAA